VEEIGGMETDAVEMADAEIAVVETGVDVREDILVVMGWLFHAIYFTIGSFS